MNIRYGIATYDRWTGNMDCDYIGMDMDDTLGGSLGEFLTSAGQKGWEVCAAFPSGRKGAKMATGTPSLHEVADAAEQITFIFKKV